MRYYTLTLSVAIAVILGGASASALTIVPTRGDCGVSSFVETRVDAGSFSCAMDESMHNVNVGAADGDYYSLGVDGSAAFLVLSDHVSSKTSTLEVSFGTSGTAEAAKVFGSSNGITFVELGVITNPGTSGGSGSATVEFSGTYRYLGFHDVTSSYYGSGSTSGLDIDSLMLSQSAVGTIAEMPLPAPALLLLAALGTLGAVRQRRRA